MTTAAAIVAFGCVNDKNERYDPVVALAFEPVMHVTVRSSETPEPSPADPEGLSFGVNAWQLPEGVSWESSQAAAVPYLTGTRLVSDGPRWRPESGDNWPSNRYTLTCIGFSPYDAATRCDSSEGVVFENIDTTTDPGDLRYTLPQTDLTKERNGGVVALPMQHALCEMDFRVKGKAGYESVKIAVKRITVNGIATKGNFHSLPEPHWDLGNETGQMLFFDGSVEIGDTPRTAGTARRVIPQTLDGSITVEYEFESPSGYGIPQIDTAAPFKRKLEAGRYYTFTLPIGPDGIEIVPEKPEPEN